MQKTIGLRFRNIPAEQAQSLIGILRDHLKRKGYAVGIGVGEPDKMEVSATGIVVRGEVLLDIEAQLINERTIDPTQFFGEAALKFLGENVKATTTYDLLIQCSLDSLEAEPGSCIAESKYTSWSDVNKFFHEYQNNLHQVIDDLAVLVEEHWRQPRLADDAIETV